MQKDSRIYIAGHRGLVGSAILKNLKDNGYFNLITRSHKNLDLTSEPAVATFFEKEKPEYVFLAAAKVGGILANNNYRADFIYQNLMIQNHVIHQSYIHNVKKLLFLGSTCVYPKNCPQPIKEEYLLSNSLEYTNEPYAIAKIAGMKMCESYNLQYKTDFISVMPTNLYGPNDNFNLETSHVLPALLRKIYLGKSLEMGNWKAIKNDLNTRPIEQIDGEAGNEKILEILKKYGIYKTGQRVVVEIWGSGEPMREFLWSEDMADACVFLMKNISFRNIVDQFLNNEDFTEIRNSHINIGTGNELSIKQLAYLIKKIIKFQGEFFFNTEKPEGTMRKVTDISRLHELGWTHTVSLNEGIERLYANLRKSEVPVA
ncbi:GDP-L-fucose synthase [Salegentibacter holothuriorum]|uniref:GDP-L-fucose synthase n=1 Tax=Salegentibacter holothuriorum TaxID=241145 RepID=A0A1T5CS94_9FLAO|nr:GDP-L-fucose synthase [Salegentibacter holothuriorum]SKB62040.1 GDP-L-fucose synthase [Salegentibacter holothuriorum]